MLPTEIAYFTVLMFLALAALIKWKRRRDETAARLSRGLCGYVAANREVQAPAPSERYGRASLDYGIRFS